MPFTSHDAKNMARAVSIGLSAERALAGVELLLGHALDGVPTPISAQAVIEQLGDARKALLSIGVLSRDIGYSLEPAAEADA